MGIPSVRFRWTHTSEPRETRKGFRNFLGHDAP